MGNEQIRNEAEAAWLKEREARANLEDAVANHAATHGLGRLLSRRAIARAERTVIDTAEHLNFAEELERHLGELTPPSE